MTVQSCGQGFVTAALANVFLTDRFGFGVVCYDLLLLEAIPIILIFGKLGDGSRFVI